MEKFKSFLAVFVFIGAGVLAFFVLRKAKTKPSVNGSETKNIYEPETRPIIDNTYDENIGTVEGEIKPEIVIDTDLIQSIIGKNQTAPVDGDSEIIVYN